MKLTPNEIEQILQFEIVWHLDHPDAELNHDQQMGFLNGLRHAQNTLRTIARLEEERLKPRELVIEWT